MLLLLIALSTVIDNSPAPPDLAGIAALITAGVGVIGFLATLFRGKRNDKRVEQIEQAASYVQGFEGLVNRLQEEVDDLRHELNSERTKWREERQQLLNTIATLRTELQESAAQHAVTRGELAELRGQIRGFLSEADYERFTKGI